jgi:predicted nucleic acid-binding protein
MKDLVNIIIDEINIESNIKNLSVVDEIKIELNYDKFNKILINYKPKNEIENYIKTFFIKRYW